MAYAYPEGASDISYRACLTPAPFSSSSEHLDLQAIAAGQHIYAVRAVGPTGHSKIDRDVAYLELPEGDL